MSFYMSIPFVWVDCSANQVTMLRMVLTLLSAALVATGSRNLVLFGSVLYALCVLLDYVDGNLARLYGTAGHFGRFLEELVDQLGPSLLPLAIGLGLYFRPDRLFRLIGSVHPVWVLLAGALTSIAYCLGAIARLYVRAIRTKTAGRASGAPGFTISKDHCVAGRVPGRALQLSKLAITEGTYLAIVFGIVSAAALDLMSVYLLARSIRNVVFFSSQIRRLIAHLPELRATTGQ